MNKVKISVPGALRRTVNFDDGEMLGGLFYRLNIQKWANRDIVQWSLDFNVLPNWRSLRLCDGMHLVGMHDFDKKAGTALTVHLNVYGHPNITLPFTEGETLQDVLVCAPKHIREAASSALEWLYWKDGRKYKVPTAAHIKLAHNMRIDALSIQVLLKGFGGSLTFRILDDEYLGDFLSRASLPRFPMFHATRFFIREHEAPAGREIHNPGHFVLKPGMSLVFEGAKEAQEQSLLEEKMENEGWTPPQLFTLIVNGESNKCSFTPGETLEDFLVRCPITADDARLVRSWTQTMGGGHAISAHAGAVRLVAGLIISGHGNQ